MDSRDVPWRLNLNVLLFNDFRMTIFHIFRQKNTWNLYYTSGEFGSPKTNNAWRIGDITLHLICVPGWWDVKWTTPIPTQHQDQQYRWVLRRWLCPSHYTKWRWPSSAWSLIAYCLTPLWYCKRIFPMYITARCTFEASKCEGFVFFFGWGFSWLRQVWGFGVKCISHIQTLIHLYIHHIIVHFYGFGKTKRFSLYSCFSAASQLRTAII